MAAALAAVAVTALAAACGGGGGSSGGDTAKTEVRLGFFPNITHSTALVGVQKGFFAKALGSDVTLKTSTFNAGPAATEAIFSDAIDATYIGPNPAINAWSKSKGEAIKIVAGAASGGVFLVVKPGINGIEDLKGKKIATPQLGNTQDVALRYWLKEKGIETDTKGGGEVSILPQENAQTLQTFATGDIDGAWVPEPFASRLVQESKGKILLTEADLWPNKQFVITHLIVRQQFLKEHPDLVKKLIEAHVESNAYIQSDPAGAKESVNAELKELSGKPIAQAVLDSAFGNITFTNDPIASSLVGSADHAQKVGLLDPVDLNGIYDLTILNEVLAAKSQPAVSDK
ncbi:ABC transporter substrate-binding protein [Streptosporangium sp. NBC_01755]|uniref:ABC transporter substrate-binding protein n=1 Tax=unclassified Streptosporangium TaxID=2632669 RepID=UPI002DDBC52B|nr:MULTISPECIES: ABC transporter substrate-binding protein [unclassified Streptosporangium]WSA25875.1 ABC transporter substrate-binding protein [Streptosporangium sp. NBC_01810]WSD02732.1 ABC transporter substrate-binding protein [Streptosporangium sp. NBC_01755]